MTQRTGPYVPEEYPTTREERRAFFPFYPDIRDISQVNEYAECVREASIDYPATFGGR